MKKVISYIVSLFRKFFANDAVKEVIKETAKETAAEVAAELKDSILTRINSVKTASALTFLLGASVLTGCSSMTTPTKGQTQSVFAFGIPGVAVIHSSTQNADNSGADTNYPTQSNPVTTTIPVNTK